MTDGDVLPQEEGPLLVALEGGERQTLVRESTWAGAYYCAHVLFVATQLARAPSTSVRSDRLGDPLLGFLHVPADPTAFAGGARQHDATTRVVASLLRGIVDELRDDVRGEPVRVLLSGFGPFHNIVDNPTGSFVRAVDEVRRTVSIALGAPAEAAALDIPIGALPHRIERVRAPHLELGLVHLPVDDRALTGQGSIAWAIERFAPHAGISMGVHRGRDYRVEIEPTSAGLSLEPLAHEPATTTIERLPRNRSLARAVVRGARALGLAAG